MLPSAEDRLDSIVRALETVILSSLPDDALLAREQVHLGIAHLQILRAQLDLLQPIRTEERDDGIALARALLGLCKDAAADIPACAALEATLDTIGSQPSLDQARKDLATATVALIDQVGQSPKAAVGPALFACVVDAELRRSDKDRMIYRAFGFDAEYGVG